MPAGFALDDLDAPKPADALGELVAGVTRILETPRTPEDAARQIVQYFVFAYDIKARSDE
jgi:hypothetical protein